MHAILAKASAAYFANARPEETANDDIMMSLARRAAASLRKVFIAGKQCHPQCCAVAPALSAGRFMLNGDLAHSREQADRVMGAVMACAAQCPVSACARHALDDLDQFRRLQRLAAAKVKQIA